MKTLLNGAIVAAAVISLVGCATAPGGAPQKPAAKPAAAAPAAAKPAAAAPAPSAASGRTTVVAQAPAAPAAAPAAAPVVKTLKTWPEGAEFNPFAQKRPVVLVLTATSCSICQTELADLIASYAMISKKADLYAVSEDFRAEKTLPNYVVDLKAPFPFLVDSMFAFGMGVGMSSTPATVVIKGDKVVYSKQGYEPGDLKKLMTVLDSL